MKLHILEMPRTAGAIAPAFRDALMRAKEHRDEFSADDFAEWYAEAGGRSTEAGNMGQGLKRYVAPLGSTPDQVHPLVMTRQGTRGRGGNKSLYKYAFKGDPIPRKTLKAKGQEPGDGDGDEDELTPGEFSSEPWEPGAGNDYVAGSKQPDDVRPQVLPGNQEINNEPAGDGDPVDQDSDVEPDDEYDDQAAADEAEPDGDDEEPEDDEPQVSDWVPQPDEDGSYAESSMAKCAAKGLGPDSELWRDIAKTGSDVDAHKLIRTRVPIQLQRAALVIAKDIFKNLNKDWEGSGKREGLLSLYGSILGEDSPDDDEVPSPEKRGRVAIDRVMPNFGLDEMLGMYTGLSEPVDFAQRDGEKRAAKRGHNDDDGY